MTIWKYPLLLGDSVTYWMPAGAMILTVQMQHGTPTLWALVDPAAPLAPFELAVVGTGQVVPDRAVFISTVQMADGGLVWHIFRRESPG